MGDYNVITSSEKKPGGILYNIKKSMDFIEIIEACVLMDMCFSVQSTLGLIIEASIKGYGKGLTEC